MRRAAAALIAFLFAAPALASSSIAGRVTSTGKPLANVTVSASSEAMPKPFITTTLADGAYALPYVPPGTYDVTFSLTGYQTLTRRATVRPFERTRVDGDIEATEEEESVTQTATSRDVHQRPHAAWTLDRETADALPIGRALFSRFELGPRYEITRFLADGLSDDPIIAMEGVENTTLVFAGAPAELGWHRGDVANLTTRGQRAFSATLRDTVTFRNGDASHLPEAAVGGLWMFAAAFRQDDFRGGFGKASLAPTARDTVTASIEAANYADEIVRGTWLHVSPRVSALAHASNDFATLRAYSFVAGAHDVAAGVEDRNGFAGFVRDRFDIGDRLVVEAGLRFEDDELLPRAGVVFGGTTRVIGTFASFGHGREEGAIGIAHQLGSSGYARAMLIRRDHLNIATIDGVFSYLLFTFGGSATLTEQRTLANAWVLIDPPLPGHDLTIAVLQRYPWITDVAVNYAWPRERLTPFAEVEVINAFDRNGGRLFRLGVGLRL
jgi:Carboxypeptidase regulatory-like domain